MTAPSTLDIVYEELLHTARLSNRSCGHVIHKVHKRTGVSTTVLREMVDRLTTTDATGKIILEPRSLSVCFLPSGTPG